MSSVGVIGTGYVGLTTAACMARLGHTVVAADVDPDLVARLSKGEVGILEDGLAELVAEGLTSSNLRFVVGAAEAARSSEFVFICVPTPQGPDGAADLSFVDDAVREIAPVLSPGAVIVNKSTVPIGTTMRVRHLAVEAGATVDEFGVASNPEFLREGHAVHDFLEPDRIVIGCDDPAVAVRVSELYADTRAPTVVTNAASAEMIKYAANAFLATKVSFINAVANLCEAYDADVSDVALGMGYDKRIGSDFLHAGPGYGGSCFPKDTAALLHAADEVGDDLPLLRGTVVVNTRQRQRIVDKVAAIVDRPLRDCRVGVWGLTFKANTDDLRDSPALEIADLLLEAGAVVHAYDPAAGEGASSALPSLRVTTDPYSCATDADAVVLLTEWEEFRWLDFERVAQVMATPRIVDARNLLDPHALRRVGFDYDGVGR
ncbi:MAG: UDP-glucose/GDP-mannose dehydrogenase family protein [Acidimicrobiia bacterium]